MKKNEINDCFLKAYNEKSRFLNSFELIEKTGVGIFSVNSDFYCPIDEPADYFTAVELQVCLNQLLYAYFSHLGLFDYVIEEKEKFIEAVENNCFITEQNIRFKKELRILKNIEGKIEIKKAKKIHDISFMECEFEFKDACSGLIKVVLKDSKNNTFEKITQLLVN
jgi:hypothetical protein